MVEGIFHGGKKKVMVGRNLYAIGNDKRFWQPVLVGGQKVSGKLVAPSGGDSSNQPRLVFDLDSSHLGTAMRSSSVKRKR